MILVFFLLTAFQCGYVILDLGRNTDLWIALDPVLVKNNQGNLEVKLLFSPNKLLPKLDSLTFELTTLNRNKVVIIGNSSLNITDEINKNQSTEYLAKYDFTIEMSKDTLPIFFQQKAYKDGRSLSAEKVNIGSLVRIK